MKKKYDVNVIAFLLRDYRETKAYKRELGRIYDLTISCSKDEAINWATKFMMDAIGSANGTRNDELRVRFLAAYDVRQSLIA